MRRSTGIAIVAGGLLALAGGFTAASAFGERGFGGGMMGWSDDGFWGERHGRPGHGHHRGGFMMGLDADKDGALSLAEIEAPMLERFAPFDKNSDGVVDQAEIEAAVKERTDRLVKRLLRRYDENADGKISKDEFTAMAKKRFTWQDLNDDGKISGDELPHRMQHMLEQQQGGATQTPQEAPAGEGQPQ